MTSGMIGDYRGFPQNGDRLWLGQVLNEVDIRGAGNLPRTADGG